MNVSLWVDECLYEYTCSMYASYRVNDSPEGLEASPYRKHVFYGVCNSRKLEKHTDTEKKKMYLLALFFYVFSSILNNFRWLYLCLVEFFDPYAVNNGSHRPRPLCLQTNKQTSTWSSIIKTSPGRWVMFVKYQLAALKLSHRNWKKIHRNY